jgi:hypothetical protein
MPRHQQLGVLRHLTPGQHHQAAEQATREQADDREDHPAMISNLAGRRGETSNRVPQVRSLARLLIAMLTEASLAIAGSSDPAGVRTEMGATLDRLLVGLRPLQHL